MTREGLEEEVTEEQFKIGKKPQTCLTHGVASTGWVLVGKAHIAGSHDALSP